MATSITIRNVPEEVRDELASRAALAGRSLQEHLRSELIELASRPSIEQLLDRVRERKASTSTRLSVEEILEHRDADRRWSTGGGRSRCSQPDRWPPGPRCEFETPPAPPQSAA